MRWFKTLKGRLFLGSFLLLLILGVHSYFSVRFYTDQMMSQVLLSAQRISDVIKSSTHHSMLHNRKEDVYQIIESLGQQAGINRIRICNKQGRITFSTEKSERGRVIDQSEDACRSCHDSDKQKKPLQLGTQTRIFPGQDGARVLGLINPILNEEQCSNANCHSHPAQLSVLGVLDVRMSLAQVDKAIADSQIQIIIVAAFLLLVVGSASFYYVTTILRPVESLVAATKEVSSGNLDHQIAVLRNDEIADLARSFNSMTRSLQNAERENREWSVLLERRVSEKTDELQDIHRQIVQIEKMASLGKLAATVAHELNNPLEGILTYAKLIGRRLRKGGEIPAAVQQTIDEIDLIQRETARCGNIVKNLLLFAKKQETAFSHVPVRQIVEKAEQILRHHFQRSNVQFQTVFPTAEPVLLCDENQIQQALVALFVNAVEAMPGGGKLTVEVRQDVRQDELTILVQDSGVGVAPEDIPRLFEPFFTTKEGGQGVGLGLSVVYGILERHEGRISVESELGKGATFIMTFHKAVTGGDRIIFPAKRPQTEQSAESHSRMNEA